MIKWIGFLGGVLFFLTSYEMAQADAKPVTPKTETLYIQTDLPPKEVQPVQPSFLAPSEASEVMERLDTLDERVEKIEKQLKMEEH